VVVDDLYVEGVGAAPHEANSPLVVYPDAVLSLPPALEGLEAISWRDAQIVQRHRPMKEQEFSSGHPLKRPKTWNVVVLEEFIGVPRSE
jgi:hypothetical protein